MNGIFTSRVVHLNARSRVQRHNRWIGNKREMKQRRKLKECLFNFLVDYCNQSSLHGLKYIVQPGSHWMKRLIWALLFISSVMIAVIVISELAARFQKAQTSTVVEMTNYPVSEIPFPSVTLCPSDRVDWRKVLEMEKNIVPKHDLEATQTYRDLLTALSTITFGDFDKLKFLKNRSLTAFHGMNITNFLRNVTPTCSEILIECWWRDVYKNCCEVFEPQRTEYGFCYSFNSQTSDSDKAKYSNERRPRRANSRGDWSGIRFTVKLNKSIVPPDTSRALSMIVFVGNPDSWPSIGRQIGVGTLATISVRCPSTYATNRVLELGEDRLPCQPNQRLDYNNNEDFCMAMCRMNYTMMRCGCNPSFMLPKGMGRDCTIEDLICLSNENDFFNKYISHGNPFFPNDNRGMQCSCPPECDVYDYDYQVTHSALEDSLTADTIIIDVHYESSTMMRYRMDIVYTQLDLLVSFGGVVGLFFGGSILSLLEFLYFLIFGSINYAFRRSKKVPKPNQDLAYFTTRNQLEHPIPMVPIPRVLPLMDYYSNPRMILRKY